MVQHQGAPGAPPNMLAELLKPLQPFTHDVGHFRPSEQVNDPACTEKMAPIETHTPKLIRDAQYILAQQCNLYYLLLF